MKTQLFFCVCSLEMYSYDDLSEVSFFSRKKKKDKKIDSKYKTK